MQRTLRMRRALRVLAVVGVWTAISFVGPSAEAHHVVSFQSCADPEPTPGPGATPTPTPAGSPGPTPTPPPSACVPDAGTRLVGTVNLRFSVSANQANPIARVDLFILSEEDGIPSPKDRQPVFSESYPRSAQVAQKTYTYAWNTVTLTPHNGAYKVMVVAATHDHTPPNAAPGECGRSGSVITCERRDLRVDNPPAALAAPRIVSKAISNVTVEWNAAKEPDVLRYKLFRGTSEDSKTPPPLHKFKEVASVTTPKANDDVKGAGNYWYTVIVTRRSVVTPQQGVSSPPSPISKSAVVSQPEAGAGDGDDTPRVVNHTGRVFSRLPQLTVGSSRNLRPPPVPDAPFSAFLPYGDLPDDGQIPAEDPGVTDPRGPVLPVAVGAFLVSSALALGRMPY